MPLDPQRDLTNLITIVKFSRLIIRTTSERRSIHGRPYTWENVEGERVHVLHCIEIIVGAVDRLSEEARSMLPDTSWGNRLRNGSIDYRHASGNAFHPGEWSAVRTVATEYVPALEQEATALLRIDFPDVLAEIKSFVAKRRR